MPAVGSAGGILVGVDTDVFDILDWHIGKFTVSCTVRMKSNLLEFRIITVYGSPYDEKKDDFLSELRSLFIDKMIPTLVGDDFNLVSFKYDKSNGNINHRWSDKFNAWVEIWSLLEIKLSSRKYTCANNQQDIIMFTIDRLFCDIELDKFFP